MITESVENKANEVLLAMLQGVEQASGFVVAQTPDVVRELLVWHMTKSSIVFLLGVLISILSLWACSLAKNKYNNKVKLAEDSYAKDKSSGYVKERVRKLRDVTVEDAEHAVAFTTVICAGFGIVGVSVMLANLTWLKIILVPKLYLLEYAAKLVN